MELYLIKGRKYMCMYWFAESVKLVSIVVLLDFIVEPLKI